MTMVHGLLASTKSRARAMLLGTPFPWPEPRSDTFKLLSNNFGKSCRTGSRDYGIRAIPSLAGDVMKGSAKSVGALRD